MWSIDYWTAINMLGLSTFQMSSRWSFATVFRDSVQWNILPNLPIQSNLIYKGSRMSLFLTGMFCVLPECQDFAHFSLRQRTRSRSTRGFFYGRNIIISHLHHFFQERKSGSTKSIGFAVNNGSVKSFFFGFASANSDSHTPNFCFFLILFIKKTTLHEAKQIKHHWVFCVLLFIILCVLSELGFMHKKKRTIHVSMCSLCVSVF